MEAQPDEKISQRIQGFLLFPFQKIESTTVDVVSYLLKRNRVLWSVVLLGLLSLLISSIFSYIIFSQHLFLQNKNTEIFYVIGVIFVVLLISNIASEFLQTILFASVPDIIFAALLFYGFDRIILQIAAANSVANLQNYVVHQDCIFNLFSNTFSKPDNETRCEFIPELENLTNLIQNALELIDSKWDYISYNISAYKLLSMRHCVSIRSIRECKYDNIQTLEEPLISLACPHLKAKCLNRHIKNQIRLQMYASFGTASNQTTTSAYLINLYHIVWSAFVLLSLLDIIVRKYLMYRIFKKGDNIQHYKELFTKTFLHPVFGYVIVVFALYIVHAILIFLLYVSHQKQYVDITKSSATSCTILLFEPEHTNIIATFLVGLVATLMFELVQQLRRHGIMWACSTAICELRRFRDTTVARLRRMMKQLGSFRIGREIGSVSQSMKCFLARKENTTSFYVLKVIRYTGSHKKETDDEMRATELLYTEFSVLSKLTNCPYVFRAENYFTAYTTEKDSQDNQKKVEHLCMPVECYATNEYDIKSSKLLDLTSYLHISGSLSEVESVQILHKLATAILQLENYNIYHGDLRPGSVIIDTDNLRLINFHFSQTVLERNTRIKLSSGNPFFLPPESKRCQIVLPFPVHVYSMGVIFYCCLTGIQRYDKKTGSEMLNSLSTKKINMPRKLSVPTKNLLLGMVCNDPERRLTTKNVLDSALSFLKNEQCFLHEPEQIVPQI